MNLLDMPALLIPLLLAVTGILMSFSRKPLLSEFVTGAKEGMETSVRLIPTLLMLIVCVSMFNASGAADWLAKILSPLLGKIGIPAELTPLLLVRPVSGSASTALAAELFEKYGADSFAGRCLSVILGSSDTVLYITAVYFGAVNVKNSRHTLPAALLTMVFCIVFSCFVVRLCGG